MKVGVTALQGDVSEHLEIVERAMTELSLSGRAVPVRRPEALEGVDALIIPGGESTTISRLLVKFGLFDVITRRAEEGMPLMGTCAGCILLAKEGDEQVKATGTRLLGLMDMAVDRNAFGRQRESFEVELKIDGLGPARGVFIRAPAIRRVWGDCRVLARLQDVIVMARQDHLLALAFHPELSGRTNIHRMFLELI
ncbi:MAG: pyridoxal 5'-phosphate synthase glutaminase subunit PdxT [Thermoplasmata archaeon]